MGMFDDLMPGAPAGTGMFDDLPPAKPASAIRKMADAALSVGKGVIAVPEAAVGLADLVTQGHAGKLAESAGIRFKDAKDVLTGWQSDDLKGKQQEFQQADGILSKTGVALSNPSLVANAVAESLPLMGAGGVGARGLLAVAPKLGAVGAGALGEGIAGAGSAGEQIRQETADGLLTGKQAALGAASGAATAAFGAAGGKLAKKSGIGDIDTMIAGGTTQVAAGAVPKGVIRRMSEGAVTEGLLEELPQSLSEQGLQNIALDRPVTQGMEAAGVLGALTGSVMGAGAGAVSRQTQQPPPPVDPAKPPAQPPLKISNTPDPFISFADGTVARQSEVDAYISGLPEAQQLAARAKIMGLAPQPADPIKPSEAMGLNPAAGPMSAAATIAVDTGAHEGIKLQEASAADQAVYQQTTAEQAKQAAEQDSIDKPITTGPIADAQLSAEDQRAILFSNKTVADGGIQYEGTLDGDILNGLGKPYPTRFAAQRRARMEGKDWTIATVFDGFVARRKDANDSRTADLQPVLPTATGGGTNQPGTGMAPAVGTAGTAGSSVDTGRTGDQPGREPVAPTGGVDAKAVEAIEFDRAKGAQATAGLETAPTATGVGTPSSKASQPALENQPSPVGGLKKLESEQSQGIAVPLANNTSEQLNVQDPQAGAKPAPAQTPATPAPAVASDAAATQGLPAAAGSGVEGAGVAQAKADTIFTGKLIPDMTDAELQQAKTHYPADHKRAPKIAKEINRRALVSKLKKNSQPTESTHGTQADQTQPQQTQQQAPRSSATTKPAAGNGTAPATEAPAAQPSYAINDAIRTLRAKAHNNAPKGGPRGDVRMSSHTPGANYGQWVSFDDAVDAARAAVASGVRPVPFQIHDALDVNIGDTDRIIAALSAPVKKPVTPQIAPAAPVKEYGAEFDSAGARAFAEGKPRVLPQILRGLERDAIAKEWYRGWDAANAAAPVSNTAAKPEIVVDKAEMRPYRKPDGSVGYEAVPIQAEAPATQARPDALSEQEKAAKAKMLGAAAKLAALLSKNTRANITPEQEQAMLPIVIELFEGAMDLGYVKFKQAARYVREFLANAIDQDAADSIPIDTLQGAYIATARRHADKAITPKKDVIAVDSIADLEEELVNPADNADTDSKDGPNATRQLDSAGKSPLEGASAKPVSGTAALGATGASTDAGSRSDPAGTGNADGAGLQILGSMGGGAGVVPVPSGRGRGKRGSAGQRGVQGDGSLQPGFEFVDTSGGAGGLIPVNPAPNAAPIPAPAFADFTIEDDFALGEGGAKAKFKGNIEAIKTLKTLDAEGRMATPTEQAVLARYVGWGGLAQAFDENNADWSKEYAELKGLMSEDDYADARVSTRYAHYTSRQVIQDGIYAALKHMGFNGGRALEGGAGVGNFIGLMPVDMRSASRFTAIEREPFSAKIARNLYPKQNIQEADFTEFVGNDDFYDVAVGNPPFASDPQVDRSGRKHLSGLSLHNYFFAKEVDMLREGGILAQVVTNSFLDASTDTARTYIADKTKFLGAIRLPNNAFSKNAGTEVTTDLIFLQKRPESEWGGKQAKADAKQWLGVGEHRDAEGRTVPLNQYFIDHPDMMLGQFGGYGTMYRGGSAALIQKPGQDTGALLASAVDRLPANIYTDRAITNTAAMQDALVKTLQNPSVHEGGYFEEDGKLFQRIKDLAGEARSKEITPLSQWTEKTKLGDAGFARIKALSAMRATLRGLLAAELSNDAKMAELRATLNTQYDAYAKEHGRINDPGTLRVFDDDPDFPLLASLEHNYTPAIGLAAAKSLGIKMVPSKATKGPIFTQRVIDARQPVAKVETPADALAVSMAERGKLDSTYIGELLGRNSDEVPQELSEGDKPLLFKDPATGEYALRDAYLSGNVRAKLVQAKQAGMFNNIKALEEVQPEDVGSHEIVARVGSPWVPESVYQDFAKMLFGEGTQASIKYVKATAGYSAYIKAGNDTANTNTWGISDYHGTDILGALLNNKPVKVTWTDHDGKTHTNIEATENANAKAQDMRNKFQDWLFADGERAELLGRAYNDTNNNYVTREFDGEWMAFPGKVPNSIVKFRRHQRNAIARIVQDRTALLDHVVGSGKTYTIVAAAMELRRTGLAKKPMIAVPNHLVKQWAADFYKLYPGANILTATKKDFEKSNRRKFLAKIATGDWDAVIIAHSSFGFIKPAPEFEHQFNNKQVAAIVATIREVEAGDGDKQQKKRTVKQLEGIKERLENRIKALRDKPMDALLDFGEIGVDQLFVDEAHMFKNLMFSTKMQNIAGLGDSKGSQRAYDMYVKANQIFSQNGRGQGLVFATGTPVSNSLAEMYHMMRYLMPTQMQEMGFESFDAWANTYASVEQVWMQKASGDGFKAQNRMSNFVNTPELLKVFDQVSDTVTMDDIKKAYAEENKGAQFPLPKLKGGKRSPVSLRKSAGQDAYMATVAARALALEQRKGPPKKGEDNILVIMSDARKAAMDIRLVDPTVTEREPGGRIDRSSQEIFARYQQFNAVKGTQIVFSDLGTPLKTAKKELTEYHALQARIEAGAGDDLMHRAAMGDEAAQEKIDDAEDAQEELDAKGRDWLGAMQAAERGFSVYDDLKAALVEKGIPEQEVAFIHDYNTDEQKAGLFRKMNSGQIRVLLGSTPKLGAGTNVQERLVALHHLDVPWKPSDVEQREGRIIRQGNKLAPVDGLPGGIPGFEVEVLAYVTQDTLDMRMWQVQETKLKMINQLRTRKIGREVENAFEDLELSAGEMQAAATGNMDLLREIQINGELKKLEQRKRAFDAQKSDLQNRKKSVAQKLASLPAKIESSKPMAEASDQYKAELVAQAEVFKATIDGKEYASAKEAGAVLLGMIDAHVYMQRQEDGKYGGRQLSESEMLLEPAQDPKAADYNPWVKRPVPLAVNFNGEDFKSRDKLQEAFSDARGDREPIAWVIDGKTLNRRTLIEGAIRQAVATSISDETVEPIGSLGPFDVSVEGQSGRIEKVVDVALSYRGQTVSSARGLGALNEGTVSSAVPAIIRMAENLAVGARQQHEYEKRQFEQALKEQAELDSTPAAGEWPEQGKLEEMRQKHKEVLQRLSGVGVKQTLDGETLYGSMGAPNEGIRDDADVVFATGAPVAPGQGVSLLQVQQIAQKVLDSLGLGSIVQFQVERNPAAAGISVPQGVVPTGGTSNGKVYAFSDNIANEAEAFKVIFHELFHLGLSQSVKQGQYIQMMLKFLQDPMVLKYAKEWKLSADGQSRKGTMPVNNWNALAVEEALAKMGEILNTDQQGKGSIPMRMWVRRMVSFMADKAQEWGMSGISRTLRAMTYTQAERFIQETILKGKSGAPVHLKDTRFASIGDTLSSAANNVRGVKLPAGYLVGDLINGAPGKLNWWHKTVGTQYNLAQRSKPFKRVFDAVQNFISDVSYFATEAADLAPNILPKLETWKDIAKSPLSAADTKAISAPIFEGTLNWARDESGRAVKMDVLETASAKLTTTQKAQRLLRGNHVSEQVMKMWQGLPIDQFEAIINGKYERDMLKAGIVFTDAELKSLFNLSDKQTPLYREFRAATDKSLTNLAIADMLRFGGDDVAPIREQVLASKDVTEAANTLADYLRSLTDMDPERGDVLRDTADKMIAKGDKAADLIKRGYAPLSRFGQYTLDVADDNGERVYFGMFESRWDAARMTRQMKADYPQATITQGTVSEQAYKMFAGVSPETLELFGDMLGLEASGDGAANEAFQTYLKLAKSSRSAMKRLIQRKGIAGFNEDAGRVLAGFVYSNARQTASSLHMGDMTKAAADKDAFRNQGELQDAAVKLVDYIKNPQEEAQAFRGLLFAQYIGGSVASAMVNMTQPMTMTFPWLSQFGGVTSAAKQMAAAVKDVNKKQTGDAKLDAALRRAEEDGTVSPQEVHQLMQQSMGKGALRSGDGTRAGDALATSQNMLSRFNLGWGKLFSAAEQFNRRVTFIAAYRTAVAQSMADPDGFARKAIAETQGVYNKGNKSRFARGALGSTLFTFKQYSIAYVEMLSRMAKSGPEGRKAALLALAVLFLTAGAGGMPGADDLDDLISGLLQSMGYNFDSKAKRQAFFAELVGEGGAQFLERGVSGLPGVPIDVSGRMGLGNLIPGTGLFTKKVDHTRDVAELAGPGGDLIKRGFDAAGKLIKGEIGGHSGAALTMAPKAMQNLGQAFDMANMGMYRDAKGMKVLDADGFDAAAKALGFQPSDVKRSQDASFEVQRMIGLNRIRESELANRWALGIFEKDADKVRAARDDLAEWNRENPESQIRINFRQIAQRVHNMNQTKAERIAKTAPKELRAAVREELAAQR